MGGQPGPTAYSGWWDRRENSAVSGRDQPTGLGGQAERVSCTQSARFAHGVLSRWCARRQGQEWATKAVLA